MLALALTLSLAQLNSDAASPSRLHAQASSAQLTEVAELRRVTASLRTQLDLSVQVSALSLEIATYDTSGPGYAKALRVIGYLLLVPAVGFAAPVFSGRSPAVVGLALFSDSNTYRQLAPTFDAVGMALAITAGVVLVLGISSGIIGWVSRTLELDALVAQRDGLQQELAQLRSEGDSFASRRW